MQRQHLVRSGTQTAARGSALLLPGPGGGELWSRWDMQVTPPDILITNYSMLNIMLMRTLEAPIFEQTNIWLNEDPLAARARPRTPTEHPPCRGRTPRLSWHAGDRSRLHTAADARPIGARTSAPGSTRDPRHLGERRKNRHGSRKFVSEFFGRDWDRFKMVSSPGKEPDLPTARQAYARRSRIPGRPLRPVPGKVEQNPFLADAGRWPKARPTMRPMTDLANDFALSSGPEPEARRTTRRAMRRRASRCDCSGPPRRPAEINL